MICSEHKTHFQNLCSMGQLLRFLIFSFLLLTPINTTSVKACNLVNYNTIDCGKDFKLTGEPDGLCESCESTHGICATNSHGGFVCLCNGTKHQYNCNGPTEYTLGT